MLVGMVFCICCDAGIVMVVSVTASIRVAVEIGTILFPFVCFVVVSVFFVAVVVVVTLVGL